nr:unnamed protein product [Callosobruchus chinensis]
MEEVLPEGKNFRLVNESELPEIIDFLGNYLPDSIKFHQTLKTFLKDRVWEFYFYVAKTWPEQAVILHFPGMTKTPNNKLYESFSVFCPCDQLDNMYLLLEEDVLIDWTQPIFLNFTHSEIVKKLEEMYSERGGTMEKLVFTDDAVLSQLNPTHAQTIHDLYPANNMECMEVFERLIEKLPCYGVFSTSGDLAAWMVIERGYLPFVVIRPENDASKGLYTKLGFKKYFQTVRAILKPKEMANDAQGGGTEEGGATEEPAEENRIDNDVNGIVGYENGKTEVDVDDEEKEQNCREG